MSKNFLLIELLNSFTKQELSNFIEFSDCRYHNTDQHATILLKFLRDKVIFKSEFDEILQCKAFKKVFPKKPKPSQKLTKTQKSFLLAKLNVLIRLAENFLCYNDLTNNAAIKNELLLKQLLEKNQIALFKRTITKEKKIAEENTSKTMGDYNHYYNLEIYFLEYLHREGRLTKEDNLNELNKNLDINYILNKLNIHITSLSLLNFSMKNYNFNIYEDIKILLNKSMYTNEPLINAVTLSSNLLETNDNLYYIKLIELLDAKSKSFSIDDLKSFYTIANNFCSKKIKEGYKIYYQNVFDLYQKMDENDLIIVNNYIPMGVLKNITTTACKVEKFEWAIQMIEKYKSFINKEFRFSVYHFNSGVVSFYQNNYKTALNHFIKVNNFNLGYDIDCRMMILKCHYELDTEYDERTMRVFVIAERFIKANKKLISKDKKAYKNFIRILLNVYRVKHKASRMTIESLLSKIEKAEFISDKKWLLEKIEGLKK